MAYQKKQKPIEKPIEVREEPKWRYEDGVTAEDSPEHREWWWAEFLRREKEVMDARKEEPQQKPLWG